ncbi:MAG: T9SS type A sorting domain-containing protein [Crocinitomicaceae bacterium]|nr:T9SS type A sorting domain-containing protein [Crocinitomicaceae bacterium]
MKKLILFLSLVQCSFLLSQVPTTNLIMEFKLDGNTLDNSGNGYHAQAINGPTYTDNRFGVPNKAIALDGINQYLDAGNNVDIGTDDFTIEAWVKVYSYDAAQSTFFHRIFGKGLSSFGTPAHNGFGLYIGNSNNTLVVRFSIGSGGTYYGVNHSNPPLNQWIHIVGVRQGIKLTLYIDNQLVGQEIIPANMNLSCNLNHSVGAVVRNTTGLIDSFLDGDVDVCRLYNRALNTQEIDSLYSDSSEVVLSLSDLNENSSEISLFPNPTENEFTVESKELIEKIKIYNLTGAIIYETKVNETSIKIPSDSFPSGSYLVTIYNAKGILRKKLIVQ